MREESKRYIYKAVSFSLINKMRENIESELNQSVSK
jgi:hypothetical protein